MAETKVYEDDEITVWRTEHQHGTDERIEPKPGTATANRETLERQGLTALDTNRAFIALAAPTNAQTLAQVKALTRQNIAIIRLLLNRLDATD